MKCSLIILSMLLSSAAFSKSTALSFKDHFEVKKVVVLDKILINSLIDLQQDFEIDSKRMIAGEFDSTPNKAPKKNYLDGLRTKLEGSKGMMRF